MKRKAKTSTGKTTWMMSRAVVLASGMSVLVMLSGNALAEAYDVALAALKSGNYGSARAQMLTFAQQGHSGAQFQLALMFHRGVGATQNYREAKKWYRLASDGGDARARNNLGVIYRDGLGVGQNDVVAYMWFNLAASEPIEKARENRDRLSRTMFAEDILQAQQLAEEYISRLNAMAEIDVAALKQAEQPAPAAPTSKAQDPAEQVASRPLVERENSAAASSAEKANEQPTSIRKWLGSLLSRLPGGADWENESRYLVQLGLFQNRSNVDRIKAKLEAMGIELSVETVAARGDSFQRLRIGPYPDEDEAKSMAERVNEVFRIKSLLIPVAL